MTCLIRTFVVDAPKRLDALLTETFPNYSRTYFQSLIDSGLVLCNGQKVKKRLIPNLGDQIEVSFSPPPSIDLCPESIPLDILYEDEAIVCINKPAGLVVHPAPGHHTGTFVHALLHHCPSLPLEGLRPGIVHRLDKDTSGALLAAKTLEAHQALTESFSKRKVHKEYLAITVGTPGKEWVDLPIGRHPFKRKEMAVAQKGRPALTLFEPLKVSKRFALVKAQPITGRTHQIRVHLHSLKTPILGDNVYGFKTLNQTLKIKRHLLHAYRLRFSHPSNGKEIEIIAPPTQDLELLLKNMD